MTFLEKNVMAQRRGATSTVVPHSCEILNKQVTTQTRGSLCGKSSFLTGEHGIPINLDSYLTHVGTFLNESLITQR